MPKHAYEAVCMKSAHVDQLQTIFIGPDEQSFVYSGAEGNVSKLQPLAFNVTRFLWPSAEEPE